MSETKGGIILKRIARELDTLRAQAQFRTLDAPGGINLCSNDYLGLAADPRLKQAVIEAVGRTSPVAATGSRLLSGNAPEWEDLEAEFAAFAGTEAALYFGSGYAANIGLLSSLLKPGDIVFSDALNHASLIDGIRLSHAEKVIYPHCDMQFLEEALLEHRHAPGAKVIVTESIFSMEGDVAPLRELVALARAYGAELVVDEAHAVGVHGPAGRGIAAEAGVEREILAIVHTCGKALASAGAMVCGSRALRDFLINRARTFLFSTAMPPYLAGQIHAALQLAREAELERAHLGELARILRQALASASLDCGASATQIVPVMLGSNETALRVAGHLRENGFAVRAIRPPTVPLGAARLRLSLTSRLTVPDVERLARAIRAACEMPAQAASTGAVHA